MKTFRQFFEELENIYEPKKPLAEKNPKIKLSKKDQEFIKHYHGSNPKLKSHEELHNTLKMSNVKPEYVTPHKKKQNDILANSRRRSNQPDDVG